MATRLDPVDAEAAPVVAVAVVVASGGDPAAWDALYTRLYDELRRLAAAYMRRERPGQTIQATALVHEVWLRLSRQSRSEWKNREQFFALALDSGVPDRVGDGLGALLDVVWLGLFLFVYVL